MDMDVKLNVWGTPLKPKGSKKKAKKKKKCKTRYKPRSEWIACGEADTWRNKKIASGEWLSKEDYRRKMYT